MRFFSVFMFVMLMLVSGCATPPDTAEDGTVLRQNPDKAKAHLTLGASHLRAGRFPQALKALRLAEQYDPKNVDTLNYLGLAYQYLNHYVEAQAYYKKALELKPTYTDARYNLGTLYADMKAYDKALEEFNLTLKDLTYPTPHFAYNGIGLAHMSQARYAEAVTAFNRALELAPGFDLASYNLGRAKLAQGLPQEAAAAFEQAVQSNASFALAYNALAETYLSLGQTEKARAAFVRVAEISPDTTLGQAAKNRLNAPPFK